MSKVISFTNYDIDGVNEKDYPDFCDAYVIGATAILEDGSTREATEEELEELTDDGVAQELALERY